MTGWKKKGGGERFWKWRRCKKHTHTNISTQSSLQQEVCVCLSLEVCVLDNRNPDRWTEEGRWKPKADTRNQNQEHMEDDGLDMNRGWGRKAHWQRGGDRKAYAYKTHTETVRHMKKRKRWRKGKRTRPESLCHEQYIWHGCPYMTGVRFISGANYTSSQTGGKHHNHRAHLNWGVAHRLCVCVFVRHGV